MSPATRLRVAASAAHLGYVVSSNASSLAFGRMKNIGVVVPFLNHWFFASVVEGAQQALQRHGYDVTLCNLTGGLEARRSVFEHFLLRQRVDAVIAVSLELTAPLHSFCSGRARKLSKCSWKNSDRIRSPARVSISTCRSS
ncbi:LacI family transcriptional regulator [Cryobacterium sp. Y82]|uniref:LacI family transcriptional regulator n=1 Tax=Cryobacterium sp. Y82 TaxID=2045017 RepID=UPI0011B0ED9F|nr:LacI family transcriptional regulator [Cryobacterium sp. Y82]